MINTLPALIIFLMWCVPLMVAVSLPILFISHGTVACILSVALSPCLFAISFLLTGGLISKFGQSGIKKGRYPRQPLHPVYFKRRIFGISWTTIYYFKPLYFVFLSIPALKHFLFRLYGYKGSTKFTVYPDTWIRDLPILKIGEGCYLANRATIGSNICMADGTILVDGITFSRNSLIGHIAMIAAGAKIGESSEIGTGTLIGVKTRIASNTKIGMYAAVMHGAVVGENCNIGNSAYIGVSAHISPNIKLPAAIVIPAGAEVKTQDQVDKYFSSDRKLTETHVAELAKKIGSVINGE